MEAKTIQTTVTGFILAGLAFEAGCSFLSPYAIHKLSEGELDRLVSEYYKSDAESTLELLRRAEIDSKLKYRYGGTSFTIYFSSSDGILTQQQLDKLHDFIREQGKNVFGTDYNPPPSAIIVIGRFADDAFSKTLRLPIVGMYPGTSISIVDLDDAEIGIAPFETEYCQHQRYVDSLQYLAFPELYRVARLNQELFCNSIGIAVQAVKRGLPYESQDTEEMTYTKHVQHLQKQMDNEPNFGFTDTLDRDEVMKGDFILITKESYEQLQSIYYQEDRSVEEAERFFIVNIAGAFTTAKYLVKASPKVMRYMHEKVIWYLENIFSDYIENDDPSVMMRNAMFYAQMAISTGSYI